MVNMISLGLVTALQHPEQLSDLMQEPTLMPQFVEELCRYHQGSAMATRRVAKVDVEYGGQVRECSHFAQMRCHGKPDVTDHSLAGYQSRRRHHRSLPVRQS